MCKFRSFFANMKTYTNKNANFTAKLDFCINLKTLQLWQVKEI